jgi:hypothetical protein
MYHKMGLSRCPYVSKLTGTKCRYAGADPAVREGPRFIPCDKLAIHEWGTLVKLVGYNANHSARLVSQSAFHRHQHY